MSTYATMQIDPAAFEDIKAQLKKAGYSHYLTDYEIGGVHTIVMDELAVQPGVAKPIDMVLHCPNCGAQHVDSVMPCDAETCESGCALPGPGDCLAWLNPPHRSHQCHSCACVWRPADVPTNGVANITTKGKADTWVGKAAFAAPAQKEPT